MQGSKFGTGNTGVKGAWPGHSHLQLSFNQLSLALTDKIGLVFRINPVTQIRKQCLILLW